MTPSRKLLGVSLFFFSVLLGGNPDVFFEKLTEKMGVVIAYAEADLLYREIGGLQKLAGNSHPKLDQICRGGKSRPFPKNGNIT